MVSWSTHQCGEGDGGLEGWRRACLGHFISGKGVGVYLSQYRFKVIQTEKNMKTLDSFSVNSVLYSKIGQVKLYASCTILHL